VAFPYFLIWFGLGEEWLNVDYKQFSEDREYGKNSVGRAYGSEADDCELAWETESNALNALAIAMPVGLLSWYLIFYLIW
jgi:hypothetical protein